MNKKLFAFVLILFFTGSVRSMDDEVYSSSEEESESENSQASSSSSNSESEKKEYEKSSSSSDDDEVYRSDEEEKSTVNGNPSWNFVPFTPLTAGASDRPQVTGIHSLIVEDGNERPYYQPASSGGGNKLFGMFLGVAAVYALYKVISSSSSSKDQPVDGAPQEKK